MRLPLVLLGIALILAGCASPPEVEKLATPTPATPSGPAASGADAVASVGENEGEDAAPVARIVTTFSNGTVTGVGVGSGEPVSFCCMSAGLSGENVEGAFTPAAAPTGILIELLWTDATFDLDLLVYGPDYERLPAPELNGTTISGSRGHGWIVNSGQIGSPDGRAVVLVTEPEILSIPGEWGWAVATKTANAVAFSVAVTEFYGEAPREGFSAFA